MGSGVLELVLLGLDSPVERGSEIIDSENNY